MSTSPPLWNAELFAKFDAIDRDATLDDDEDEWRAFEQQVEEEVQRRGKGQEYARIDKGKAVDGTSAEYPPSSPPLFDEDPLPSDPPASELRAGPSSSSARRPVSTLAAMPRSFAAVKANTPARLTNTFFSAPTIQTPSGPPPLRPPPAMVTPRALGGRPFDSPADFPTPVQTQSQTPGTFGGRRRDDPASPAPLETDARSELLNRRDLQKLSTRHELFLKKHHSALGRAAKPVSGRPPVRTVSTSMRSLVGGILKGMRFVIASETKQVAKHEKYWDVIMSLGGTVVIQPDTAITHVIYNPGRNASASMLAHELGVSSLSDLPECTVVVKYDWIVESMKVGRLLDTGPWLSFPPTTLTRTMVPRARMEDITAEFHEPAAVRRKREHTASDSETESSMSQVRARRAAPVSPDVKARSRTGVGEVATRHRMAAGTGWKAPRAGEEDGLDVMITGVLNGSEEDSEAGSGDSDQEGNPNPVANRFKCGQKHDGKTKGGPNEWLAKEFDKLFTLYEGDRVKNDFAIRGYQKTAGILRRTTYPITSGAQARKIKGIGDSMAQRIDEFLTGAKGRAYYENTEQARTIATFKDIYGVGKSFANTLYQRGARTIEDLRTGEYGLTSGQKIGVDLYEDLCSRIPRDECRQVFENIKAAALTIDPKLWIEIMGSYRRGQETSGDIDVLITRDTSDGITHATVIRQLVQALHRDGVITHDLSVPHDWSGLEAKWMGVGKVSPEGKHRRIDILCIPYEQWGAALLYFTGNDIFNRSIRLYARKKGYSLNQRGLFRGVIRDRQGNKLTEGEAIASRTEQEIFDVLGIRWRAPEHRRP